MPKKRKRKRKQARGQHEDDGAEADVRASREFSEEEELAAIHRRYEVSRETLTHTIPALRRRREFMETYDRLIDSGWKDWHVLLAVFNIAANYRARVRGEASLSPDADPETFVKRSFDRAFEPETLEDPRPPVEEFGDEAMRFALDAAIVSFLQAHGWVIKNPTPNFGALRRFAAERYRYFDLDVEHEPFFRGVD